MKPWEMMRGFGQPASGGGGGETHTHWRIYITAQNGGGYAAAQEIQMFDATSPGTNLCTGGTPVSDGYLSPYATSRAFNGNTGGGVDQCWVSSTAGSPHWIGYQFAAPVAIATIKWWARIWSGGAGQTPRDFQIQYSDDGSAWITSKTYSGETAWTAGVANAYSTA